MRRSLRRLARPAPALLLVTALSLLARLWALGWRVAHQDEGRVGDWIHHYTRTGHWEYRAIIHGPFIPHVDGILFSLLGASDFTARLPIAVVGGLLPLAAWLFRERLRDSEAVALGVLLAANPVLLYYSRFMRNDVLLAAFALFAVGFFVRAQDTGRARYLYAAAFALALAFTTKESVLATLVAWGGSLVLLFDHRLFDARVRESWRETLVERVAGAARSAWRWRVPAAVALLEFWVVVVLFYAPLPDLYRALGDPTLLPSVVDRATVGTWRKFWTLWAHSGMRDHSYLEFAGYYLKTLAYAALPLSLFAALGFVVDRYAGPGYRASGDGDSDGDRAGAGPRDLVAFCGYWGVASALGYPVIMDITAAWATAHAIVPLAVPAAVGVGVVYRLGAARADAADWDAVAATALALLAVVAGAVVAVSGGFDLSDPTVLVALLAVVAVPAGVAALALADGGSSLPTASQALAGVAAALLLLAALQTASVAYHTTYEAPQSADNRLVQYAQPSGQMQPQLAEIERIARENEGVDVLFYGEVTDDGEHVFYQEKQDWAPDEDPPLGWFSRLPFPWYLDSFGATVDSTQNASTVAETKPPVVIAPGEGMHSGNDAGDLDQYLEGYRRYTFQQYLWGRPVVVFVRESGA